MKRAYAGRSSEAYHTVLLLLVYGYATGTHSSRKIERATYDSLAFRFIACDQHPDHDTLATFRRRFGEQFAEIFVQVLQVARENQLSCFGSVSLHGTKIHANASRRSVLSYGHAERIETSSRPKCGKCSSWPKRPIKAACSSASTCPRKSNDAKTQLAATAAAKAKIEARAQARFEQAQADYQAKMAQRQAKEAATGKKPGGKLSKPPPAGARAEDQINLTDDDSPIMKMASDGFEQCYNKVRNEWTLVCLAGNLKRMAVLRSQHANRTGALRCRGKTCPFRPTTPQFISDRDPRIHRPSSSSPTGC